MVGRTGNTVGHVERELSPPILAPSEPVFLTSPPTRRRRHRRRWPWIAAALVFLAAAGVGVIWLTSSVATPVTMRQAESRLGTRGIAAADTARPAPGVYGYSGTGSEKLSLPPLSQAEGPSMPGTVTLAGPNCFVFRIDYSTHHWETWRYCLHGRNLWESGGQSWQLWAIGPLHVTNLSSFNCAPRSMALPAEVAVGESWMSSCTGTNTSVTGKTVSAGPYRFEGFTTVSVGGTPVRAAHFLRLRTDSGAQHGTERSEVWFSASTGLPLRVDQDIKVTSPTPFGTSTYAQVGTFALDSMVPHH
ncbi:MAG TPA: hypothetical protein VK283_07430 [Acidimicrobiales bacterium]|nr:hypothetical protein [Acidimicrobiales bacterium]